MMRRSALLIATLLLSLWHAVPAWAAASIAIEDVRFDDPAQMERYKALIAELRCPKCLNTNLAGSDAPIAVDLRGEIRRQILDGKSDQQILEYLTNSYGEFILYKPPLHVSTSFLWFGPPLLLLVGIYVVRRMMVGAREAATASEQLSPDEQRQLQQALAQDKQESRHG